MSELDEIERHIALLAQQVGAQGPEVPTVGFSTHTGLPCVLEDEGVLIWLTMDSGREVSREPLTSRDEALYRALDTMTHAVARRYATDHQVPGVPYWAVLFKRQLELARAVDPRWYVRICVQIGRKIEENVKRAGSNSYIRELLEECRSVVSED